MDKEFTINTDGLHHAVDLMAGDFREPKIFALPMELPQSGMGSIAALSIARARLRFALSPNLCVRRFARLGGPFRFRRPFPPW